MAVFCTFWETKVKGVGPHMKSVQLGSIINKNYRLKKCWNTYFLLCMDGSQVLAWKQCKYFNTWHIWKTHSRLLLPEYCFCWWATTINESLNWNQFAETKWTWKKELKVEECLEQRCLYHLSCWKWITGQRRHEFTCYIKLLVTTRVVPSEASFSFTLGDLIWNCSVKCWPSVDERISTTLDVSCLENRAFLSSYMLHKLWGTRGVLLISLPYIR